AVTVIVDRFGRSADRNKSPRRSIQCRGLVLRPWFNARRGVSDRNVEGECAAFSRFASQLNLSAKQVGEFAADRQPETGAAIFAAGARIRLLERFEDELLLVRRDADAGIFD